MPQSNIGYTKYGMSQTQPYGPGDSAVSNSAVTTAQTIAGPVENPMFWLLGLVALASGLAAFSTSAKIGKFHASASV